MAALDVIFGLIKMARHLAEADEARNAMVLAQTTQLAAGLLGNHPNG